MPTSLSASYLAAGADALRFLPLHFQDREGRVGLARRAAARALGPAPAPALLAELREQQAVLAPSAARERHLESLAAPGTVVAVSGQQVGLFLGPLYTLYKAASVVVTARAIERESGVPCVPLFWLQTEDHDFAEIRRCRVARPSGPPLELELAEGAPSLARVSVAHRALGPEVQGELARLEAALGGEPHAAETLAQLGAHYRPGRSPGAAFAGLLAELFAEEGLLLLDPRRPAVARLAAPLYRSALLRAAELEAALAARSRELREAGFEEQVPVRAGATLLCLHQGRPEGPRYRLGRAPAGYRLQGTGEDSTFSEPELLELLETEPLRFSTTALLRPLVQDHLLPTVAYVAGPHEIDYLAQLAPLYALLGLEQPLVVPRARFRCLEAGTRALLGKLGLRAAADAEVPRADLLRRLGAAADRPPPEELIARLLGAVAPHLAEVEATHPSLREPVQKARASFEHTVRRLCARYGAALLERDQVTVERVDRLQAFLTPGGAPQERVLAMPSFACRHGARAVCEKVLAATRPFEPALRDLEL